MKIKYVALLMAVILLVLTPMGTLAEEPKEGGELVVLLARQYAETLDIFNTTYTDLYTILIYEPLVSKDLNYDFQPGLADSWEVSEDGLSWTFHLHKGVKFHDGSDFNSEVVKWWIEGMKEGVNAYMFEPVTEVETPDDHTAVLHVEGPFPNLLYNLSTSFSGIMSKEAYEKYGEDYGTKYAIGTGPFILEEWVPNDYVTLVKNPDYNWAPAWMEHEGPAYVDRITIRFVPEDASRGIELESGTAQINLDVPPRDVPKFRDNPDYQFFASPAANIQYVGMNVTNPFLKDIRVRKAIWMAIDRETINETLFQALGRPRNTYLSAELGGDKGVPEFAPGYDLEKARELLAEAGWRDEDGDGIVEAYGVEGIEDGTKYEVKYWSDNTDEMRRLAEATQKMFADIGIKADIELMDKPTYDATLKEGGQQLFLRMYGWDNNDILEWFFHSKNLPYPNKTLTNDPKLDEMMDDANYQTATWEERDAKYVEIHKYLIDQICPWAPIRQMADRYAFRANVKGIKIVPLVGLTGACTWQLMYLEE